MRSIEKKASFFFLTLLRCLEHNKQMVGKKKFFKIYSMYRIPGVNKKLKTRLYYKNQKYFIFYFYSQYTSQFVG